MIDQSKLKAWEFEAKLNQVMGLYLGVINMRNISPADQLQAMLAGLADILEDGKEKA